jgi:hypothetical protein
MIMNIYLSKLILLVRCNVDGTKFSLTSFNLSFNHSSDIRNTSIFRRCSKRSIFKYFLKNILIIQRLENWPLYQVFSSIF